jgi:hypothetical protein
MLPLKADTADKKRRAEAARKEAKCIGDTINQIRREKLIALYAADEEKYESELRSMSLAFRKERT